MKFYRNNEIVIEFSKKEKENLQKAKSVIDKIINILNTNNENSFYFDLCCEFNKDEMMDLSKYLDVLSSSYV